MININPTLNYLFASLINNLSISGTIVRNWIFNNIDFLVFLILKPLNIDLQALFIYLYRFRYLIYWLFKFLNHNNII